jgi:hypothetical protein
MAPLGKPVVPDLVHHGHELGAHEDDPGAAVADGVGDFVGGEAPVDDGVGRAHQRAGQGDLQAGRVVLVQKGDPVAGA